MREHAAEYGLDARRFAFIGNSSGGWAAAFAATTSDIVELSGEEGVDGTSSGYRSRCRFFPPTDFLMDEFAAANDLPSQGFLHDPPNVHDGFMIASGMGQRTMRKLLIRSVAQRLGVR